MDEEFQSACTRREFLQRGLSTRPCMREESLMIRLTRQAVDSMVSDLP